MKVQFFYGEFTGEGKIRAAQDYLAGQESKEAIAKRHGVNVKGLQQWVELYRHHGEDGLRKRYTNNTAEFELDVLNFMNDTGASSFETAAVFNIPSGTTVVKWKEAVDQSGTEALIPLKKGRRSMKNKPKEPINAATPKESLQEEVERLRKENAYLKKLNALV